MQLIGPHVFGDGTAYSIYVGKIPPDLGSRGQHHVSSSCSVSSVVISRVEIPVSV